MQARVLVVDDEPQILRVLGPTLRAAGYEVCTAATGGEAIRKLHDEMCDLVVLDLGLPDIDGADVIVQMRNRRRVPILVLTARATGQDRRTAMERGAADFMYKPFQTADLLARLQALATPLLRPF